MDKEKIKQFILSQREAGVPDEQIHSFLVQKGAITTPKPEEPEQNFTGQETSPFQATGEENLVSGTAKALGNLPSSTYQLGKNVVTAVVNPIETGKSIVNLVKGTGAKLGEKLLEGTDIGQSIMEKANASRIARGLPELKKDEAGKFQVEETPELQTINNVGKFITDRYGSLDKFKETAIEDPAGVLADLATVVSGGAAAVSKVGTVSKIAEISKVGSQLAKVSQAIEPVTAITKTLGKAKNIATKSKVGQIIKEAVPTVTEIKRNQVVKALDLTPGDLSNIKKATGNDVTDFIVSKNLIKDTPEAVADSLTDVRKSTKDLRNSEIKKVTNVYTPEQIPGVIKGLDTILKGVDEVPGLEKAAGEIRTLMNKAQFSLEDVQRAKDLLDDNSSIYSKIGDVKSGATARGLDNIRKEIRKFIEDEVNTSTQVIPKSVRVWVKSKFSDKGDYADFPVTRKERNITLYQGGNLGDKRQFWTPDKKYAAQFGKVKEKTGSFYKIDNGNRVTDVYVEAPNEVRGTVDIRKLNNDIQTSYAIEDAINTRATRNLTRDKIGGLSSLILGVGGASVFNPAVGLGLYIGKKLIDTPSFRLGFTKALNAQPINKIKRILTEVKNKTVSPATQKLLNELADQAKNNLPVIESGSKIIESTKSEQQKQTNR
jgi:hypothetical protein